MPSFPNYVYLWTVTVLFTCFIIGMVGLVSPAWRSGAYGQGQWLDSGLIMQCHHEIGVSYHRCAPFSLGSQIAWFEISRIFCSLALVLLFTLVIGCAFLHVVDKKREDFMYPLGFSIFTGLLGMIGSIVYAVKTDSLCPEFNASLSWGWAVYLCAVILVTIISVVFVVFMKQRGKKPKTKQIAPRRDIIY